MHEAFYLAPVQPPTVDPRPCETCAHHHGAEPCDAEDFPHAQEWAALHGRLPADVLGVGTRCPRWERREVLDT